MSNYTVKRIDEMDTAFGGGMRLARAAPGVTSFGLQIEEFPPDFDQYPEHSHAEDGQEEVYVVVRGTAEIDIDGQRIPLDTDTLIRVGPRARRRIIPGPQGYVSSRSPPSPAPSTSHPTSARSTGELAPVAAARLVHPGGTRHLLRSPGGPPNCLTIMPAMRGSRGSDRLGGVIGAEGNG